MVAVSGRFVRSARRTTLTARLDAEADVADDDADDDDEDEDDQQVDGGNAKPAAYITRVPT